MVICGYKIEEELSEELGGTFAVRSSDLIELLEFKAFNTGVRRKIVEYKLKEKRHYVKKYVGRKPIYLFTLDTVKLLILISPTNLGETYRNCIIESQIYEKEETLGRRYVDKKMVTDIIKDSMGIQYIGKEYREDYDMIKDKLLGQIGCRNLEDIPIEYTKGQLYELISAIVDEYDVKKSRQRKLF